MSPPEYLLLILIIGFILGHFVGYLFGLKKSSASKELYENLLRQEAAAQERILLISEESQVRLEELKKYRDSILTLNNELAHFRTRCPHLETNLEEVKCEKELFRKSNEDLSAKLSSTNSTVSSLQTEKLLLEQQLTTLSEYVDEVKKQTRVEFEVLAHQILEAKSKSLSEQTEKSLDVLLGPLKEKLQTFSKTVEDKYTHEAKERHALKSEIERLITLNDKMTSETNSLTKALRGDSKIQGDWGELVLERILEASGLRKDEEYSLQKVYNSEEGSRLKPDVIINLPENKHVVIDSKVSLKAYDIHRSSQEEVTRTKSISEHIKSIEKHVEDLSHKHYPKLHGLNSPELVFMFIPIEPAYLLAMQTDPDLSSRAWKKGVAIVTSTTLLTSLKTVASIWKLEKQNKNALEIAQEGAKLYDKFVLFLDDFVTIGKSLESGQKHFSAAMGKLKEGPGNIFKKMELLRQLGAAPHKQIKREFLE